MSKQPTPRVEWHVKCDTCNYGRRFGAAKISAEMIGAAHRQRYYDHVVHIIRSEIMHTFRQTDTAIHALDQQFPF